MLPAALLFGSFNPLHEGHLGIARHVLEACHCDEVWFVVSPCNPFKSGMTLLPAPARLEIVEAAIGDDRRMRACDVEFSMPRPSYTLHALERLSSLYPAHRFLLLIGADNLLRFHEWRGHEMILQRYPLLVYPRPGISLSADRYPYATITEAPLFSFSSTTIRERVARHEDVSGMIPPATIPLVERYYGNPASTL